MVNVILSVANVFATAVGLVVLAIVKCVCQIVQVQANVSTGSAFAWMDITIHKSLQKKKTAAHVKTSAQIMENVM